MAVKAGMRVLGFMTGTSLDAVDMAVLETDGEAITGFGPCGERKLSPNVRSILEDATRQALQWRRGAPEPEIFAVAARAVADEHLSAAQAFMFEHGITRGDLDLVGFHGQTVLHESPTAERPQGRTVQLGDGARLAAGLGVPVAFDFRTADVAAGGQGAPLAPVYHRARAVASGLTPPVAALNLGGVGNITVIGEDGALEAFDTGPANGMIDLLVQARTDARLDVDGAFARAGRVHEAVVQSYLSHSYFSAQGAKSLDRFDFSLEPVAQLSLEDAAATLTAFAARAAALGIARCQVKPERVIACGGGRHNPVLMAWLAEAAGVPVEPAEAHGWRGDAIEAEAFAYLAARTAKGLPISFPSTTGAPRPMTGGRIVQP
jgi:anhydro-N-acetylmuramic acid kinase